MCLMCWLAQSIPLLSIWYNPTPADIEALNRMSQTITLVAQYDRERLMALDDMIEQAKSSAAIQQYDRSKYMITAMDDMIEQAKILY